MDIRVGNWFLDVSDNNLCKIVAVKPNLIVERFAGRTYAAYSSQLRPVNFTEYMVSLAGFKPKETFFIWNLNGTPLFIYRFDKDSWSLEIGENNPLKIRHVHELQNAIFDGTGHVLEINLFGSR